MPQSVSITARTEYLGPVHRIAAGAALAFLVIGVVALVVLRAADVASVVVVAVVVGAVAGSVVVAAVGRQVNRGAVILAVDDDWIYLGNEDVTVEQFALDRLRSVTPIGTPATSTSSMRGPAARRLTIGGVAYVELEIARTDTAPGTPEVVDRWQVAVSGSDPAAEEVIARLRAVAPSPREHASASAQASGPRMARVADAGTDDAAKRLWEAATRTHDAVMSEYAPYELDTELAVGSPAITDVTRSTVARFHDAMDAAESLRTDAWPDDRDYADRYQRAVFDLDDAWRRCLDDLRSGDDPVD